MHELTFLNNFTCDIAMRCACQLLSPALTFSNISSSFFTSSLLRFLFLLFFLFHFSLSLNLTSGWLLPSNSCLSSFSSLCARLLLFLTIDCKSRLGQSSVLAFPLRLAHTCRFPFRWRSHRPVGGS